MDWNEPKSNKKGAGANQPPKFTNVFGAPMPVQKDMESAKLYVINEFSDFLLKKIFDLKFEDRNTFCLAIGLIPSLLATGFSARFAKDGHKDSAAVGLQMMTAIEIMAHVEQLFDESTPEEQEEIRGIIATHNEIINARPGMVKIVFDTEFMTQEAINQRREYRKDPKKDGSGTMLENIIKDQDPEIKEAMLATRTMSHEEWGRKYGHLASKIAAVLRSIGKKPNGGG